MKSNFERKDFFIYIQRVFHIFQVQYRFLSVCYIRRLVDIRCTRQEITSKQAKIENESYLSLKNLCRVPSASVEKKSNKTLILTYMNSTFPFRFLYFNFFKRRLAQLI